MKKLSLTILAIFFLMTSAAYAGTKANCGCGLGTVIFEQKDGLIFQVLAATTNGIFGNQTFGITSGTLGCDKFQNLALNEKLNIFVADNMDGIAVDIAAGQGESLDALADLAEVPSDKRMDFFALLQGNFNEIYPSAHVTSENVVESIVTYIEQI